MAKKRDDKEAPAGLQPQSGFDSNNVTVGSGGSGQAPLDPGATVLGANADTLEDEKSAGRTVAAATPPDAPPGDGDGTALAASAGDDDAGPAQQATLVSATQPPRDRDSAAPHPDDVPTSPDALVEQGGDAALDATFLSGANQGGGAAQTGATKPPKGKGRKDVEDYFETLIEDPQQQRKPGEITGLVIGDYQVISELGRGGMGVVYKARHRKLDRVVALKMILAGQHAGSEVVGRFISEARAVAHLQHPGIVQIFDIGEHKGLPWFSLEFVEGTDLQHFLAGQPQHPRDAAQMVVQISEAMQYAHDNDILHRDLKPANILLDQDKRPKVTDFGLAKRVDPEDSGATSDGTIMGSPSYMPPEQARGELSSVSPRSDLYSLGAVLYQMLTGRPPFLTDRPLDTVMQVINNDPIQPRDLQPGIPVDLETICMKALQKDAAARYLNCQEFAADLTRFLNGEPILARPVSRLERAWRWCKRNPKIAIPSGVASFFIIATAIISSWAWNETAAQAAVIAEERDNVKEQRDEAETQRGIANKQRAIAEDNERIAQKQARLALDNIQFIVTDIDKLLGDMPGSGELRIAILDAVSKKWDDLDVEMAGGVRGEAIPTFMALRHRMAIIYRDLDELEKAREEFTKNEQLARERIALKGRNDATRMNLAKVLIASAEVTRRLDASPEAAMKALTEAADLIREILRDPQPQEDSPSENEILEVLAAVTQNLGVEYLREGRIAATEKLFRESLESSERILNNILSEPGYDELDDNQKDTKTAGLKIGLDKSRIGLAYILLRLGRTAESLELYDEAIASRREIHVRRPQMLPLTAELAGHLKLYGKSLLWIDDLNGAEKPLVEAKKLWEELYNADPEKVDYKRGLAEAAYFMGTLRNLQGGRDDEAMSLFEESRLYRAQLTERSPDEKNRINQMLSEARVGNFETARQLVHELGALTEKNSELHLERARSLAALSDHTDDEALQQDLRDQALTALERSITEGFSDPFRVTAEPELDSLHDSDRFKQALVRLKENRDAQQASIGN